MEIKIVLKSGKEQSVKRLHPWIFSGAIKQIYGTPAEGDIVKVFDNKNNFLAVGHYQPVSIAVRILSFTDTEPDQAFFRNAVERAFEFRKAAGLADNPQLNVFRLIHGEGDGLPGLIADYYNGVVVMQAHSVGMYRIRKMLAEIFRELDDLEVRAVYDKSVPTIPFMSGIKAENEYLYGDSEAVIVMEYGLRFKIDWVGGQKT